MYIMKTRKPAGVIDPSLLLQECWERERKAEKNPLKIFYETWVAVQKQLEEEEKQEEGEESDDEDESEVSCGFFDGQNLEFEFEIHVLVS